MKDALLALHQFAAAAAAPKIDTAPIPHTVADQAHIQAVLTIIFTVTGAIAVMMIVIGGIKYTGSQGDPQGVAKAKDTIIYAVVGLVLAIMATAIVDFVMGRV